MDWGFLFTSLSKSYGCLPASVSTDQCSLRVSMERQVPGCSSLKGHKGQGKFATNRTILVCHPAGTSFRSLTALYCSHPGGKEPWVPFAILKLSLCYLCCCSGFCHFPKESRSLPGPYSAAHVVAAMRFLGLHFGRVGPNASPRTRFQESDRA